MIVAPTHGEVLLAPDDLSSDFELSRRQAGSDLAGVDASMPHVSDFKRRGTVCTQGSNLLDRRLPLCQSAVGGQDQQPPAT